MNAWKRTGSVIVCLVLTPALAVAQPSSGRSAVDGIEVMTGLMSYDLQGTGTTAPYTIRGTKSLTRGLALDVGTTMIYPDLQFGSSSLVLPEVGVTYSFLSGRFRPFVGGGAGVAIQNADALDERRWRTSLTAGGGARFLLSDRLYAIGEMRLRGMSDFSASTAEWLGGIGWRFK